MSFLTPYEFRCRKGLPPDGDTAVFYGFDRAGTCYLLRWTTLNSRDCVMPTWHAVGWGVMGLPVVHRLEGSNAGLITSWSVAPAPWPVDEEG